MHWNLRDSGLSFSADLVDDLITRLKFPLPSVTWADYPRFGGELNKRIEHELKGRKFYQLKPEVADLFDAAEPFGNGVALRFGSAVYDVREACNCFACERYTAAVFHLMRVLECALKQFAGMLGISYQINWDAYIKAVTKFLQTVDAKSPEDRAKREFVSKAAALLQYMYSTHGEMKRCTLVLSTIQTKRATFSKALKHLCKDSLKD